MNEFNINLVGKEENVKKEEILNNFDFNYLPMNNLPISYFPFNNPQLSNEFNDKDIDKISGIRNEDFVLNNYLTINDFNDFNDFNVSTDGANTILKFTSGIYTLKIESNISCHILIVGGGGSGANNCIGWEGGGGGGGGGVGIGTSITLVTGTYDITIGAGGDARYGNGNGLKGGDTSIVCESASISEIAYGGGYGSSGLGGQGGSGGGSSGSGSDFPEALATTGRGTLRLTYHGYNGGNGFNQAGGSGGGGAGSKGIAPLRQQDFNGGNGGRGIVSSITGTSIYYGGGGGGSANAFKTNATHGTGGDGGGAGGYNTAIDGEVNTGGGGGGANSKKINSHSNVECSDTNKSGAGGSGVVIIKILSADLPKIKILDRINSLNTTEKTLTIIGLNTLKITKDINVDLLLVGGGGGGAGGGIITHEKYQSLFTGGGGGGGEVIYLQDYKLQKGIYAINIGLGGVGGNGGATATDGRDGGDGTDTYLMKDNNIFLKSRGGNKGNGGNLLNANRFLGGASRKSSYGKGADGNKIADNSQNGEFIRIEGNGGKYYGNGGKNALSEYPITNDYRLNNGGYGGKGGNSGTSSGGNGLKGSAGIFILKYKNNDIDYIKKYITTDNATGIKLKSSFDLSSRGYSLETALDNPNYKLLVYRIDGSLILNKDITCDILLVGGGGGGGLNIHNEGGGGGGGGGVGIGTITLQKGTYTINIGNGGNGGINNGGNGTDGYKGGDTIINLSGSVTLTANGGGAGGGDNGENGGSGGGGSGHTENKIGGNAIKGSKSPNTLQITFYGNNGGESHHNSGGGGGGGAGAKGYSVLNGNKYGGNGGNGILSSITGMPIYYGGGGGGASANGSNKGGKGGIGGGGNGGNRGTAENGEVNTGGGGGGSSIVTGGIGGSGIVIIRVKKEDVEAGLTKDELYEKIDKDTRIINDIKNEFNNKLKGFYNNDMPYNKFSIYPLVILIIIFWIFIFLFLLKFVHHYFANIYLYILIFIIIFLLLFGSLWFLYSNNDL